MKKLFQEHLNQALSNTKKILEERGIDSLLIESGSQDYYFLDDQAKPFRPNPHFLYFCPDMGYGHRVQIFAHHEKPSLYFYIPKDFWHEVSSLNDVFWDDFFDINVISDPKEAWGLIKSGKNDVVISDSPEVAMENGFKKADSSLLHALNWNRASKTEYEIESMRKANEIAAKGHKAAKEAFFQGKNEFEIFTAYLLASGQRETDLPYGNIVALDKNSAILHYQTPKKGTKGKTFLIDAGARFNGYCSDITRSYFTEDVPQEFKDLNSSIENAQKQQIAALKPGKSYVDIHKMAYESISQTLIDIGVIKCSQEESLELKIPFQFFPHGIGHPIGIQVHDVSGKQFNRSGETVEQPKDFPFLRTIRDIQENDALTIEPGGYFIPLLLKELKEDSSRAKHINWSLVEKLQPYGGVRIEDDVIVRKDGVENLTRSFLD